MATEKKVKTDAVLTLYGANKWTPKGREKIAEWLRKRADDLIADGANYGPTFRARRTH